MTVFLLVEKMYLFHSYIQSLILTYLDKYKGYCYLFLQPLGHIYLSYPENIIICQGFIFFLVSPKTSVCNMKSEESLQLD